MTSESNNDQLTISRSHRSFRPFTDNTVKMVSGGGHRCEHDPGPSELKLSEEIEIEFRLTSASSHSIRERQALVLPTRQAQHESQHISPQD